MSKLQQTPSNKRKNINKDYPISQSLQNSCRKIRPNRGVVEKVDNIKIFAGKGKLNLDLTKVKPGKKKSSTIKKSKAIKMAKSSSDLRMKDLITKILQNRDKNNESDPSISLESPINSSMANDDYRPTESTYVGEKSDELVRYEQIIEEISEADDSQSNNGNLRQSDVSIHC